MEITKQIIWNIQLLPTIINPHTNCKQFHVAPTMLSSGAIYCNPMEYVCINPHAVKNWLLDILNMVLNNWNSSVELVVMHSSSSFKWVCWKLKPTMFKYWICKLSNNPQNEHGNMLIPLGNDTTPNSMFKTTTAEVNSCAKQYCIILLWNDVMLMYSYKHSCTWSANEYSWFCLEESIERFKCPWDLAPEDWL